MELPTPEEIADNPGSAIVRLRNLRSELDGAERAAIAAAVRQGWSLKDVADRFGISRQAVTQRMQRALVTRRPKVALLRAGEAQRWVEEKARRDQFTAMLIEQQEIMRERRAREERDGCEREAS